MTTERKKKSAPTCSRCPHDGATWRELNGKRTWFCQMHLREAEREVAEANAKRYQESRVEDLSPAAGLGIYTGYEHINPVTGRVVHRPDPAAIAAIQAAVQVPTKRQVKPYRPRDPALMCGHPTTKSASGSCRNYYPCGAHGQWRLNEESAAPAHPVSNTAVDHPPHYNVGKYEVIDVIEDWRLGFNLGNVVKYVARAEHKGRELEDLDKAAWYINREIARRKG